MSNRNVTKIYGDKDPAIKGSASEEEFQPLATRAVQNAFTILYVSSDSDVKQRGKEEDSVNKQKTCSLKKTNKKHKEEQTPRQYGVVNLMTSESGDNTDPQFSTPIVSKKKIKNLKKTPKTKQKKRIQRQHAFQYDDINKTLMEIEASTSSQELSKEHSKAASSGNINTQKTADTIFSVKTMYLNAPEELKNYFGSENSNRRYRINTHRPKDRIVSLELNFQDYSKGSISMSLHRIDDNGCHFFMYDHCKKYQAVRSAYLKQKVDFTRWGAEVAEIDVNYLYTETETLHVEGLLQGLDTVFRWQKYKQAEFLLEKVIVILQHFAHPLFKLTGNVRLEYTVLENRPFHIAILKYLYLLSNKACHRTALELAKLLIKLDPSDPLAVIFIIDSLALKAREHQWLIDATEYFYKERDASLLFNLAYSVALARFHVDSKEKGDLRNANAMMQKALYRHPFVALHLLKSANISLPVKMLGCPLYTTIAEKMTSPKMKQLIRFYTKYIWSRWKENNVLEWFIQNINHSVDEYQEDTQKQEEVMKMHNENLNIFKYWPREIERHLCIIHPMAQLLVDGEIPDVQSLYSADPIPPEYTINRYSYIMGLDDMPSSSTSTEVVQHGRAPMANQDIGEEEENARGGP